MNITTTCTEQYNLGRSHKAEAFRTGCSTDMRKTWYLIDQIMLTNKCYGTVIVVKIHFTDMFYQKANIVPAITSIPG